MKYIFFIFACTCLCKLNAQDSLRKTTPATAVNDSNPSRLDLATVTVVSKQTSSLNKVSQIDIRLRPVHTTQDILRIVPGMFIAQHAGGGKADQLFLRGYDIDHGTDIAETVDGIPVNMVSHAHGQGYADLHFIIPELIRQVDFDKGPYLASKGNLATAGWVDFKTRDQLEASQVKVEGGSFGYGRAAGFFRLLNRERAERQTNWYVGSEYFGARSYFESPQDFRRMNLFTKFTARIGSSRLQIIASTFNSRWKASGQIPERAVRSGLITRFGAIDDSEGGNTGRTNLSIRFEKQWNSGWASVDQVYLSLYRFNLFSNFTFFLRDPVNGDAIQQKENRLLYGYTGSMSKAHQLHNKQAEFEVGYGFRMDHVNDLELNRVVRRQFLSSVENGAVREGNAFIYADERVSLTNKLDLQAGVRYDRFRFGYRSDVQGDAEFRRRTEAVISPKLNFSYTVHPRLKVYLNNGIGFHSNDSRVVLSQEQGDVLPRVFGTDLGLIAKPARNLIVKAAIWHLASEQEFIYVGDEGIVEPSGRSRRIGVDLSIRYQPLSWLYLDVDLNAARPRALGLSKGSDYIPLGPVFTSIGGLSIRKGDFSGAIRYRQISRRPANETNSVRAEGYFIADLQLNYRLKRLEFGLSLENVMNREWREAQFDTESLLPNETSPVSEIHFTPGTPRFFKFGIAYTL